MENENLFEHNQNIWLQWGIDIHNDPEQVKRRNTATSTDYIPISLSDSSGVFRGSKKNYDTELSNCACRDFALRRKPCKHMYRLAYELGVYMFDGVVSDPSKAKKRIDDVMPVVFSLPDELQLLYRDICYSCGKDNKNSRGYSLDNETAQIFLDKELICLVTDKSKLITHCYVNDVRRTLKTLTDEKLPRTGAELFDYALKNFPDINLPLSPDFLCYELPPNISHLAMSIRKRLFDKFPVEHNSYY